FGAVYLFYRDWRARLNWRQISVRSAIFLGGAALPLAATCLVLWRGGGFGKFLFLDLTYARADGGFGFAFPRNSNLLRKHSGRHWIGMGLMGAFQSGRGRTEVRQRPQTVRRCRR